MEELEKLRAICTLTTRIVQHTDLKIPLSEFACMEDDGYNAETYTLGWHNDRFEVAIEIGEDEHKEYKAILSIYDFKKKDFIKYDSYEIEKILIYPTCSKLRELIKFVNDNF